MCNKVGCLRFLSPGIPVPRQLLPQDGWLQDRTSVTARVHVFRHLFKVCDHDHESSTKMGLKQSIRIEKADLGSWVDKLEDSGLRVRQDDPGVIEAVYTVEEGDRFLRVLFTNRTEEEHAVLTILSHERDCSIALAERISAAVSDL